MNISFPGIEGETLLLQLDAKGIMVSTGSACSTGSLEPSHVLKEIGLAEEALRGSIRFTLGRGTTSEQIEKVLLELPLIVDELKRMG